MSGCHPKSCDFSSTSDTYYACMQEVMRWAQTQAGSSPNPLASGSITRRATPSHAWGRNSDSIALRSFGKPLEEWLRTITAPRYAGSYTNSSVLYQEAVETRILALM